MAAETQYVVKYPKHSSVIQAQPKGGFRPYRPDEIYARTWTEAHDFLLYHAKQRAATAQAELENATSHLAAVMAMQDPTQTPSAH